MNKEYHIIGLMSGTSLDGLDIVKCTFKKEENWSFQLENFETIKYSENNDVIKIKIRTAKSFKLEKTKMLKRNIENIKDPNIP